MIRYRPRFRGPEKAAQPVNWREAQKLSSLLNPIAATPDEQMIDVDAPDGRTFAIDAPAFVDRLRAGLDRGHELRLLRSL